jgi:hypothetical protein
MFKSSDRRRIDNKFWTETCRQGTFICQELFPDILTLPHFSGTFYKLHLYYNPTRYECKVTRDKVCNDNDYRSFNEFRWS